MCLVFISLRNHPHFPLVIASNRDEFYERRTAPAHYWKDEPGILAGRDLEALGTWMGITTTGKIGLVTNYRDPAHIRANTPSRGHLVTGFLTGSVSAKAYVSEIQSVGNRYNGFNLLVGDVNSFWYVSNYKEGVYELPPGLYGLSNHLLNTPWPKVERGKEKIRSILARNEIDPKDLFEFLYDHVRAEDDRLPDTGIGVDGERALSSMFIKTQNYGSRCSTVVLVDNGNHVLFSERVYDVTTFEHTTNAFEFDI